MSPGAAAQLAWAAGDTHLVTQALKEGQAKKLFVAETRDITVRLSQVVSVSSWALCKWSVIIQKEAPALPGCGEHLQLCMRITHERLFKRPLWRGHIT